MGWSRGGGKAGCRIDAKPAIPASGESPGSLPGRASVQPFLPIIRGRRGEVKDPPICTIKVLINVTKPGQFYIQIVGGSPQRKSRSKKLFIKSNPMP